MKRNNEPGGGLDAARSLLNSLGCKCWALAEDGYHGPDCGAAIHRPDYGVGKSDEVRAAQAHHGEPHEFRTICRRCGEPGMLHVSIITPDERVDIRDTRLARTEDAAQQREGAGG